MRRSPHCSRARAKRWTTPLRLTQGPAVVDAEAALAALDDGTAELAIVENSSSYRHPMVRTVAPLYPSVLHIAVRPDRRGLSLREVFSGATVFAGTEQSAARRLLDRMASMYAWSGVEFSYVDALDSGPDYVFVFAPISPSAAPVLDGYELAQPRPRRRRGCGLRGRWPEPRGAVSSAVRDPGGDVWAARRRPRSRRSPSICCSSRVPTYLASSSTMSCTRCRRWARCSSRNGPISQSTSSRASTFPTSRFRCIPGALAFRARNEPGFAERASGIFEVVVTVLAGLTAGRLGAACGIWRGRRKARIDEVLCRGVGDSREAFAGARCPAAKPMH